MKYGLGNGFPIARASEAWFFVICIKSKRSAWRRSYFRTQITRTTDAFASDDPPDALTPWP